MNKFLKRLLYFLLALFILINVITAFHAYKFTHFYDAAEVTITPQAQKTFWDQTKEILFGFTFVKKRDSAMPAGFQKVFLTTKDGLKLEGWYNNHTPNAKGTVALFHGHGGNKTDVLAEANEFIRMGYNVFLLDFRAHGNSEGHTCTIGSNEAEDVKLTYNFLKAGGEKNIVLWGISLGAATITHTISEYNLQPQKIILELPFGSLEEAVKARLRMMKLPTQPLAAMLTFWGSVEHTFWAFDNKPSVYAAKISCPVLLQFAQNDIRVTTKERQDIYNNISAPKQLVIYKNSGHESLCKNENAKWVLNVTAFLNK